MRELLAAPRGWLEAFGEIASFSGRVLAGIFSGRVMRFFGVPVGVGTATAKSIVLNTVMVHLVGMVGTQIFWGSNPRAPIGG